MDIHAGMSTGHTVSLCYSVVAITVQTIAINTVITILIGCQGGLLVVKAAWSFRKLTACHPWEQTMCRVKNSSLSVLNIIFRVLCIRI